jgi:hypothetical protein
MLLTLRIEIHRIFNPRNIILFFCQIFASLYFAWEYKSAFPIDSGFGSFIRTFTIFGAFIMMLMGFLTFPAEGINGFFKKGHFIKTILSRLLVLDIYFLIFYGISYRCARVLGIDFTSEEIRVFFTYMQSSIALLNFFYAAGLGLNGLNKYKESTFRKKKIKTVIPGIPDDLKRNNMLFILVNKEKQQTIFDALRRGDCIAMDRNLHLIMPDEVRAFRFIDYACREKKIDRKKAAANIEKFNISKQRLKKKLSYFSDDEKKMLLTAIVFADSESEKKDIVLNDFLKGVSRNFEESFFKFLGLDVVYFYNRRIIYISSDMYTSASSLYKKSIDVENYFLFQFMPQMVSLR